MLLAMAEVMLQVVALGLERVVVLVLDLPAGSTGGNDACTVTALTLPGTTIQLSNQGGIITLLNNDSLKVHGVQYNRTDASEQGRTIVV